MSLSSPAVSLLRIVASAIAITAMLSGCVPEGPPTSRGDSPHPGGQDAPAPSAATPLGADPLLAAPFEDHFDREAIEIGRRGGGDAATGLFLIAAPGLVLRLLGATVPGGDLVLLRFVGVFVGCVGLACLYPWLLRDRHRRESRLVAALEMTAGVRLAVALFLSVAVMTGRLDLPWATVGAYDALVASAQIGLLARGFFGAS